ncbi:MAG: Gfo/Idh/MocA family oxidoreductase [Anaerolineae bacterium]|nr:Gfo/Idh/MocA family oxidoreductase [Anaerolineae bacterium]
MNPLRAGILGCGDFANRHAQIMLNLNEQVELVAFSDRNEWKARAFAEKYAPRRAGVYTDHHTMLDQAKLDLLVICLPPYGHTDEVEQAAQHGVHILIEKPIALDSEQGWRMVEAADKAGIKTQVGFMYRFGEAVERFKAMQESGQTGPTGLMSARYFCNALHASWWRVRDKSGGQVVEQVIHMFDLLRYFMGDPVTVYCRQENLFHGDTPDYTVEDVSATVVGFKGGGLGVVNATNGAIPGKWISDYRVVAQRLTAEFQNANQATFTPTGKPDQVPILIDSTKDFRRDQMLDLLNAIRTNGQTRTPLSEGAKSLDLVLAARRSADTRSEVQL